MVGIAKLLALLIVPIVSIRHREIYGNRNQSNPARAFLISHRSCSQDPHAACNRKLFQQLAGLSGDAEKYPFAKHFLYQGLPSDILNDPKWTRHVEASRGRGYWFWKAALTNRLLKRGEISNGDIVVWLDGDCLLKNLGDKWQWGEVLRGNFQYDFFVANLIYREQVWTKGDIYAEFNVSFENPQYGGSSRQVHDNFWLMRVNEKTRDLLLKWEDLVSNFHLVSDEESVAPNSPLFRENRHDQSLLSMLLKASMLYQIGEEPYEKHLHPKYGVRGLRAIQGRLQDLISEPVDLKPSNVSRDATYTNRWICINDECHDLVVQPKGFVPRGVAPA
jgi:hypothetical protein